MSEGHCICSTSAAVLLLLQLQLHLRRWRLLAGTTVLFLLCLLHIKCSFNNFLPDIFGQKANPKQSLEIALARVIPFRQFNLLLLHWATIWATRVHKRAEQRNTNQISTSRKRRLDAVIQQQSFHITIPPCCKSSDKIRYRSPLTKPYLSEGETLNIKGYLQSRPAFYWILLQ